MAETGATLPRLLSVRSVCRETDFSKSKVYALIEREDEAPGTGLKAVRIDGMVRIRREDFEEFLERYLCPKPTGSESIEVSGAQSPAGDATRSETRSALRRQRLIGRGLSAKSPNSTAA